MIKHSLHTPKGDALTKIKIKIKPEGKWGRGEMNY